LWSIAPGASTPSYVTACLSFTELIPWRRVLQNCS